MKIKSDYSLPLRKSARLENVASPLQRAVNRKAEQNQVVQATAACSLQKVGAAYLFQCGDKRIQGVPSCMVDSRCQRAFQKIIALYKRKQQRIDTRGNGIRAEIDIQFHNYRESVSERAQILPDYLEVRQINRAKGLGLIAKQVIPKNTIIGEYAGVIKTDAKADKEENEAGYCFGYDRKSIYAGYTVDAQAVGNCTRFINHASAEKANLEASIVYDELGPHIVLRTIKKIYTDRELLLNYGQSYWSQKGITPSKV